MKPVHLNFNYRKRNGKADSDISFFYCMGKGLGFSVYSFLQIGICMKRIFTILLAAVTVMSCGNNPQNSAIQKTESITMNLYYTGTDGNARKFVEDMESSGTANAIRSEEGNLRYDYFFSAADPETVLLIDSWTSQEAIDDAATDQSFIRK